LAHKFIKNAKKTSYLTELIERMSRWQLEDSERNGSTENVDEYVLIFFLITNNYNWYIYYIWKKKIFLKPIFIKKFNLINQSNEKKNCIL